MYQQAFPTGLYRVVQRSEAKGIEHHGILVVGGAIATVIDLMPSGARMDPLEATGQWQLLRQVEDVRGAMERINTPVPTYSLLGNNCEHFANYIEFGRRESIQVQRAAFSAMLVGLLFLAVRSRDG
jgi:Lecithin retinol acyltransferase